MLFPTTEFALFFAVVFIVGWLLSAFPVRWKLFMVVVSYFFYGYADVRFCLLLGFSTIWNWLMGAAIFRAGGARRRRAWLVLCVAVNLAVLGWFKYYDFFVTAADDALRRVGIGWTAPLLEVALPVGISFFTFQAISYVADVWRKTLEPSGFLDFAVYLSFFPHLVAGPIVRASELLPQMATRRNPRRVDASRAFFLIFAGLFKKLVLASFLATAIVDRVFATPRAYSSLEIVVAVYAYAVQIYADFSGYTDMAIGLALLMGVDFPQNFDAPYTATSLQDFWRRWHMTLSRWLRDYLYIPLGGNRGSRWRRTRNLMLTMLLGGLWHGAAWTFVVWGAIHGGWLAIERALADREEQRRGKYQHSGQPRLDLWGRWWRRVLVFHIVCLAWVFFRAETFTAAGQMLTRVVTAPGVGTLVTPGLLLAIAFGLATQFVPERPVRRAQALFSRLSPGLQGATLGVALVVIVAMGPQGVAPFIYYRF